MIDPFLADVYSLGATIFEMTGGKHIDSFENRGKKYEDKYPNLFKIIKKMVRLDFKKRPSFADIKEDISYF